MTGEVWVNGAKVSEQPLYDTAAVVGSVFQNPGPSFSMWIPPVKLHLAAKILTARKRHPGTAGKNGSGLPAGEADGP